MPDLLPVIAIGAPDRYSLTLCWMNEENKKKSAETLSSPRRLWAFFHSRLRAAKEQERKLAARRLKVEALKSHSIISAAFSWL